MVVVMDTPRLHPQSKPQLLIALGDVTVTNVLSNCNIYIELKDIG